MFVLTYESAIEELRTGPVDMYLGITPISSSSLMIPA